MVEMAKKVVWLMVGLLLVALVSSAAVAGPSKEGNWQSIGERLAGHSVTLQELLSALGKPVSGLSLQALNAQVHIGPVHKYVVHKKVEKSAQNESSGSAKQVVVFAIWSWIMPWNNTVPTDVYFGTVVEASSKVMYMSVNATLTGPEGIEDNEHGWGMFTDEVDASGEKWVDDAGSYCSGGHFYYFDFTLDPPTGGGYSWPKCAYLSQ